METDQLHERKPSPLPPWPHESEQREYNDDDEYDDNLPRRPFSRFLSRSKCSWIFSCFLLSVNPKNKSHKLQVALLGQGISFLLATAGAAQSVLSSKCHLSAPNFTVSLYYALLSLILIPLYRQRRHGRYQMHELLPNLDEDDHKLLDDGDNNKSERVIPDRHAEAAVIVDHHSTIHKTAVSNSEARSRNITHENSEEKAIIQTSSSSSSDSSKSNRSSLGYSYHHNEYHYTFLRIIPLQANPAIYFTMGALDVYASYCTVLAFHYTTITSVSLLAALTIPSTMILSKLVLQRSYTRIHFLGVTLCLAGVFMNVLQDYQDDSQSDNSMIGAETVTTAAITRTRFKGDLLACLGALLYGCNNVLSEMAVRQLGGPWEYLGVMAFFATLLATLQWLLVERDNVASFFGSRSLNDEDDSNPQCSPQQIWGLVTAFCLCSAACYVGCSRFLQISEATFFNLSLQTSGLYSVLFSVMAQQVMPPPLFFLSFLVTVTGVVIYETMAPTPVLEDRVAHACDNYKHDGTAC